MATKKNVLILECPVCKSRAHVTPEGEADWFPSENPAPVPVPEPDPEPEPTPEPTPEPENDSFLGNW